MPDAELVAAIRALLAESALHGEGCRNIWARLRFGIRNSTRRVLRLTREHGLQARHRMGRLRGPRAHVGTIRTARFVGRCSVISAVTHRGMTMAATLFSAGQIAPKM